MYWDFHSHTLHSADSQAPMEEMVAAAEQHGLKMYCFTDHYEPEYPHNHWIDFSMDVPAYHAAQKAFVEAYAGPVALRRGIEVGMQPTIMDSIAQTIGALDWDFVLASDHLVGGKDPYYQKFTLETLPPQSSNVDPEEFQALLENFSRMSPHDQCSLYLEELLCCLKQWDDYSVVGHICYPQRWPRGENVFTMRYEDFAEQADALLRHIIQSGHGIEVNTSSYATHNAPTPGYDFVKRYKQLGGEILTLGSDAHLPQNVAQNFRVATRALRDLGFKYLSTFTKRKVDFVKIPEV